VTDKIIWPTQMWRADFYCDAHKGWTQLTWFWNQSAPTSCSCGHPILIHKNAGHAVSYEQEFA
jgi:hypothetical protein